MKSFSGLEGCFFCFCLLLANQTRTTSLKMTSLNERTIHCHLPLEFCFLCQRYQFTCWGSRISQEGWLQQTSALRVNFRSFPQSSPLSFLLLTVGPLPLPPVPGDFYRQTPVRTRSHEVVRSHRCNPLLQYRLHLHEGFQGQYEIFKVCNELLCEVLTVHWASRVIRKRENSDNWFWTLISEL